MLPEATCPKTTHQIVFYHLDLALYVFLMIAVALNIYIFSYENTGLFICFNYDETIERTLTNSKTQGNEYISISNLLLIQKLFINGVVIAW